MFSKLTDIYFRLTLDRPFFVLLGVAFVAMLVSCSKPDALAEG